MFFFYRMLPPPEFMDQISSSRGYKRNPVINVPCFHTNHNELQTPISIKNYVSLLVSEIGESKVKSIIS